MTLLSICNLYVSAIVRKMKLTSIQGGIILMSNRFILNETSYHGAGAIKEVVTEVKARGLKKGLVVTDKDLIKFGVATKVTDLLDEAGLPYEIYDEVKANPTVEQVKNGVQAAKDAGADYLIAIGGGSPQDTCKGIGIILANPEFEDVVSLEGVAPTKNICKEKCKSKC